LPQGLRLTRVELLTLLADTVASTRLSHPTRVAVDGPDAAGKSTLADELAARLRVFGRTVVRVSIDGFHRPRAERYQRGRLSPDGYYEDSFDLAALRELLLDPLGPGGSRMCRTETFDYRADAQVPSEASRAPCDAILIFDGVFLLRPELSGSWDLRIHLKVAEKEILRRARQRDTSLAPPAELDRRYQERYLPAQRTYAERVRPAEIADFVVVNDNPAAPVLAQAPGSDPRTRV
jgi:uridine kinase